MKVEKRPRAPALRSPENVEALGIGMQRSPGKSTQEGSRELRMWRLLRSDLKLFPYQIFVLHKISEHDKERRLQFAAWAEDRNAVPHNTWFSDDAYFHLDGTVSKKEMRAFWQENIHATIVKK